MDALIHHFRAKFGDDWVNSLHKNLKPSPLKVVAEQFGVPLARVRKARAALMTVGLLVQALPLGAEEAEGLENHEVG
jgi:hypothetical protein